MNKQQNHITDEELVRRYQNGEEQLLKVLIRRFHPLLQRNIGYRIGNTALVDDIVQECWYAIIPKLDTLELKISFRVWVMAVARHKAIDWLRTEQRVRYQHEKIREHDEYSGEDINDEALIRDARQAIQKLPPTQRIVIELFYRQNLTLAEISDVLDIAKGTVKSRLFYAREKLKHIINR